MDRRIGAAHSNAVRLAMTTNADIFAAGAVVCARSDDGGVRVLLIHDRHDAWTLPKGRLEDGESEQDAARREVAEETGIECTLMALLDRVSYPVQKKGRWRTKYVAYFYATAPLTTPTPRIAEGISDAAWFTAEEALAQLSYPEFAYLVHAAIALHTSE